MEYGEGKTGCYRILIKGYQWIWATTRSYISFNHWNSKPEIYCSTTKVIRLVFEEPFCTRTRFETEAQVNLEMTYLAFLYPGSAAFFFRFSNTGVTGSSNLHSRSNLPANSHAHSSILVTTFTFTSCKVT